MCRRGQLARRADENPERPAAFAHDTPEGESCLSGSGFHRGAIATVDGRVPPGKSRFSPGRRNPGGRLLAVGRLPPVMNRLDFRYLDVLLKGIGAAASGAPPRTGHPRSQRPARCAPRTTGTDASLDSSRRLPWPDRPGGPGRRHPRRQHQRTAIHPFPGKRPAAKTGRPYPARPAGRHSPDRVVPRPARGGGFRPSPRPVAASVGAHGDRI